MILEQIYRAKEEAGAEDLETKNNQRIWEEARKKVTFGTSSWLSAGVLFLTLISPLVMLI